MKRWERIAARISHPMLYVLMFALPLSGWLMASASPLQDLYSIQNMVFGAFALPDPFTPGDPALEDAFRSVHVFCALTLTILLFVHAAAALKHHFVARNNVLRRMIAGR
jgi:cytochrome b561